MKVSLRDARLQSCRLTLLAPGRASASAALQREMRDSSRAAAASFADRSRAAVMDTMKSWGWCSSMMLDRPEAHPAVGSTLLPVSRQCRHTFTAARSTLRRISLGVLVTEGISRPARWARRLRPARATRSVPCTQMIIMIYVHCPHQPGFSLQWSCRALHGTTTLFKQLQTVPDAVLRSHASPGCFSIPWETLNLDWQVNQAASSA